MIVILLVVTTSLLGGGDNPKYEISHFPIVPMFNFQPFQSPVLFFSKHFESF